MDVSPQKLQTPYGIWQRKLITDAECMPVAHDLKNFVDDAEKNSTPLQTCATHNGNVFVFMPINQRSAALMLLMSMKLIAIEFLRVFSDTFADKSKTEKAEIIHGMLERSHRRLMQTKAFRDLSEEEENQNYDFLEKWVLALYLLHYPLLVATIGTRVGFFS